MPVTAESSAPYTPTGQILEIIGRFREKGNPTVFTLETLGRIGVPDSLSSRTLQALKVLDLVDDDGKPTPTFKGIQVAPSDKYESVLQDWLHAAYADVFAIYDANEDETRIRDGFRNYKPSGQQGRMVALFLGLCELAGLRAKAEKKKRAANTTPRQKPARPPVGRINQRQTTKRQNDQKGVFNSEVPAALSGLLASLPDQSKGWTKADRDKFYLTFGAVLDFCYPIVAKENFEEFEDEESVTYVRGT